MPAPEDGTEAEPRGGPRARESAFLADRLTEEERRRVAVVPGARRVPAGFDRRAAVGQYRTRLSADGDRRRRLSGAPAEMPWLPIGPSVLRRGQSGVHAPTSGRVAGIAITPGEARVYVAAANGGVWLSEDRGASWRSLMDGWDLDPATESSDSLACGAIAVVAGAPDRVYVGTGEAGVLAYNGVGPVVSADGGRNWHTEPVADGSSELGGHGFFALAVDPGDPDRVVAGTSSGLYRREPGPAGFVWAQKIGPLPDGDIPSVAVARRDGTTMFYAVPWSGPVFASADGNTWAEVGTGFPSDVGRVGLGVQPGDPGVVYALAAGLDDHLHGLYRLDIADGVWREVTGVPANLFGVDPTRRGQGGYDLAVAVDPGHVDRVFIGGSLALSGGDWSAALYRGDVIRSGPGLRLRWAFIGNSVHPDVHAIVHPPGDSNALWVGCDGGAFRSAAPGADGNVFEHRNAGLATQTLMHIGQHPTEDAVLFCGSQDNGGQRYTGEEAWLYSSGGDAGYQIVNWADPSIVMSTYVRNGIRVSRRGGDQDSYHDVTVPVNKGEDDDDHVLFYAPIAGTPYDPDPAASPHADLVAFGTKRPWITTSFGEADEQPGWQSIPTGEQQADELDDRIRALCFASAARLWVGTMSGGVYRFDRSGRRWERTAVPAIDGLSRPITGIAADTPESIYVSVGGTGDYPHVWRFDGRAWQPRSGRPGSTESLLGVQANAVVVDPAHPGTVYVGADLGVWRSTDDGLTWAPYSQGLPDAAVVDLVVHGPRRLLRAATHGRGAFERPLDPAPARRAQLYVRHTQLDTGRFPTVDGRPHPARQGELTFHYDGPDIKLDPADIDGGYEAPLHDATDFLTFVDRLGGVRAAPLDGATTRPTRVRVQVHNRSLEPADRVRVMLLVTEACTAMPALPDDFAVHVRAGIPIRTDAWHTVGFAEVDGVRAGAPRIASFNLTADLLPPPANDHGSPQVCLLALIHHPDDPFVATPVGTDELTRTEPKAAQTSAVVIQSAAGHGSSEALVLPVRLHNPDMRDRLTTTLRIGGSWGGRLRLHLPGLVFAAGTEDVVVGGALAGHDGAFDTWARRRRAAAEAGLLSEQPYDLDWSRRRIADLESSLADRLTIEPDGSDDTVEVNGILLEPGGHSTVFLELDPPVGPASTMVAALHLQQIDKSADEEVVMGGLVTRIELTGAPATSLTG